VERIPIGRQTTRCSYIWYRQLAKDPVFQAAVKERWTVIYPYLQSVSKKISEYVAPVMICIDMDLEGVLCGSPDIEIGDGGDTFDEE
jgi:hypothetical protein